MSVVLGGDRGDIPRLQAVIIGMDCLPERRLMARLRRRRGLTLREAKDRPVLANRECERECDGFQHDVLAKA